MAQARPRQAQLFRRVGNGLPTLRTLKIIGPRSLARWVEDGAAPGQGPAS